MKIDKPSDKSKVEKKPEAEISKKKSWKEEKKEKEESILRDED